MKKKYKVILVVLIVVAGVFIAVTGVISHLGTNLENLADLPISKVDLSKIDDGIYNGSYDAFPISAEVKVTVSSRKITNIQLVKHTNGQGSAAEVIPERVIGVQTLDVDTVSGATYSSKVILKAIENALNGAGK